MKRIFRICLVGFFLVATTVVNAEEKFGIPIYSGAKYDAETSDFLKQISANSVAYRTSDHLDKVADFYAKQPGLKIVGSRTKESVIYRKDKVDVAIQNPFMDMKTGKIINTTLISVVKP